MDLFNFCKKIIGRKRSRSGGLQEQHGFARGARIATASFCLSRLATIWKKKNKAEYSRFAETAFYSSIIWILSPAISNNIIRFQVLPSIKFTKTATSVLRVNKYRECCILHAWLNSQFRINVCRVTHHNTTLIFQKISPFMKYPIFCAKI